MWIDESAGNEVLGRHYHGKIVVEGEQMQKNLLGRASDVIFDLENIGDKGAIDTRDEEQTFVTGEDPNNYVWYSGKLWRAVSKDSSDNSVKLITQWNMTGIRYSTANGNDYSRSMLKEWLNDTSVDGFLGNLREPEKFLVMNSEWNATKTIASNKIPEDTIVIGTVGALNAYEFGRAKTYLNNGLYWWSLSPSKNSSAYTYVISPDGLLSEGNNQDAYGVRPAVNLQPDIKIVAGDGTEENPYRLKNDFDEKQDGVFLNTRYSGEYIQFGAGENSLYRIVSKEFSGVKIVSEEPLKTNGVFMSKRFSTTINTSTYDPTSASFAVAYWLNYDYLNTENGYLTPALVRMIENSTWYLGVVKRSDSNLANYKLAKYTNISGTTLVDSKVEARVGLLRFGEQFTGQSHSDSENTVYYLITPESNSFINLMTQQGIAQSTRAITNQYGVRPSLHLKSSVKITGGEGTKQNPFTIGQ